MKLVCKPTDGRPRVAVIIPCLNEAATIGKVVSDFTHALPDATICVFDNGSTDGTAMIGAKAGAIVVPSPLRGKGNVIRHMSQVIDADVYVLVDGDDTYPAEVAPLLVDELVSTGADMVVATRLDHRGPKSFRLFHAAGNRLISRLISLLFHTTVMDVLSGYRVLSRRFVQLLPMRATGFEIETEMTLHAVAKSFHFRERAVEYESRPPGSTSKLNTWSDGLLILKCIFVILKDYKPLVFFWTIGALLACACLLAGSGPIIEFYQTGLVYRVPRAILAAGLAVLSTISFAVGLILDTNSKYHDEQVRLLMQVLKD